MNSNKNKIFSYVDKPLLIMYILLVICGWFSIYSAVYNFDSIAFLHIEERAFKQLIWISLAAIIGVGIMMLRARTFEMYSNVIYIVTTAILLLTIFIAPDIKGSHSWLVIGPISIQPAEFSKYAVSLALAHFMSSYNFSLMRNGNLFKCIMLILVPMMLIILQSETGTALVYFALILVLYREGLPSMLLSVPLFMVIYFILTLKLSSTVWGITPVGELVPLLLSLVVQVVMMGRLSKYRYILRNSAIMSLIILLAGFAVSKLYMPINLVYIVLAAIAANIMYAIFTLIRSVNMRPIRSILVVVLTVVYIFSVDYIFTSVLEPHQQARIKVSLGLEDDPRGIGYNVNQSKIAVGSGEFLGKGYLSGTQTKLNFVPEQDTDFIFSTIGEELGFLGSSAIIILYVLFIHRIIVVSERQERSFGRIYGYCVASIFIIHFAINIGMVLGLCPVIGIPLPFFSYGGSSLWGFTILLFTLIKIDSAR